VFHTHKSVQADKPIEIINSQQATKSDTYIINEQLIRQSLQSQSQIVSYLEDIDKKIQHVDDSWLGKRVTSFEFVGTYQMGINTEDIDIVGVHDGTVYIKLGKPVLISLELPFDQMNDEKIKGYFRLEMDEKEKQKVYKEIKTQIKHELLSDKDVIKTARLYNESVVKDLVMKFPGVKQVQFEEEAK
jgi:hypothetical protein